MRFPRLPTLCLSTLVAACASSPAQTTGGEETTGGGETAVDVNSGGETTTTGETSSTGATSSESSSTGDVGEVPEPEVLSVLEDIVFYDGYAATVDEPVPAGVLRHSNALNAIKLTEDQLASIQDTLKIGVVVGALCYNYDRIGSVNLALVPKGSAAYVPGEVERIELARFITPFMDMNESPNTVPYEYDSNAVVPILKDEALRAEYDLWLELSIFGVPYAANTEIAGCAGRNDTSLGSLFLYTDSMQPAEEFDVLLPLAISESFNNYAEGASDALGTTRKTIEFELPPGTTNSQLVLITSNHGANAGGEEYIRREHSVYVDDLLALQYTPGRDSCEPFRKYNTQGNGIYGPSEMTDEEWQSFSNWCPGDVIDTRIVPLGAITPGVHEFVIDVPDAAFAGAEGDFPFSLYVQAQR